MANDFIVLPMTTSFDVGPGEFMVTVRPQIIFRPLRLMVAPESAHHVRILSLTVGMDEILMAIPTSEGLPGTLFPPVPEGEDESRFYNVLRRVAQPGLDIRLRAICTRQHFPLAFHAALYGETPPVFESVH